jgi:hypothetical protein
MASWGAVVVLAGFTFDATTGHIGFAPLLHQSGSFRSFWSGAGAYGTIELSDGHAKLAVLGGDVVLRELGLPADGKQALATHNGKSVAVTGTDSGVSLSGLHLRSGDVLDLRVPALSLRTLPELATLSPTEGTL